MLVAPLALHHTGCRPLGTFDMLHGNGRERQTGEVWSMMIQRQYLIDIMLVLVIIIHRSTRGGILGFNLFLILFLEDLELIIKLLKIKFSV